MSKFVTLAIGVAEVVTGVVLEVVSGGTLSAIAIPLIITGIGTTIAGLGTLLSKGPVNGFATTTRNPTAPWKIVYGRARVGGTIVYLNMWPGPGQGAGGSDQMLDMVIVLAAHPCQSVDALLFDQQRVMIDTNAAPGGAGPGAGTSFTPVQQTVVIQEIKRIAGWVTVTLNSDIPYLMAGDRILVQDNHGGSILSTYDLVGTQTVAEILVQMSGSLVFTFLSGGANCDIVLNGQVKTLWADYGRKVYYEPILGTQTLGQTFSGMLNGTPLDGDLGDFVSPEHTGGVQGADVPNPWTANCSLQGKTAVFLRLHYSTQYFQGGIPQISFLLHGKTDIYDPRTSTTGYSENAALCIANFLSNTTWGFKAVMGTEIPYANLIAAANVCDEPVPLASSLSSPPATEPAYACNGQFELTMKRGEILQNLLTSCAGRLTYVSGQYVIWPGAWVGPSIAIGSNPGGGILALGDYYDIAAGPIKWIPTQSGRDLFNGVKGTYISQANRWMPSDFPPYCQDTLHGYIGTVGYEGDANLAWDGGDRRWLDIQLPFTISSRQAQTTAKIELLRRRWAGGNPRGTGTFVFNLIGYQIANLDILEVTIPYLAWSGKLLETTAMRFRIEDEGNDKGGRAPVILIEVDVVEVDSSIYDWSTAEELTPQGYVYPTIPGLGTFQFFATELVPGYSVPFPWSPAYLSPLKGDAMWPTPVVSGNDKAYSSFGIQVQYGTDTQGNATVNLSVKGTLPANELATSIAPPQISCVSGTSGSLPPGTYLIAASAISTDTTPKDSTLSTPIRVSIPSGPSNGSIAVTVSWPANSNGGIVYMASSRDTNGYYKQSSLTSSQTTLTITNFDRTGFGAPDPTFDHLAVAWKQIVHGGPWAGQILGVTHNTLTISGNGMTTNMWANRVVSLIGKIDSTQDVILLNMPVSASSASSSGTYTLTIGPNSNGDQLPDLTTLLELRDAVLMRFHGTFGAASVYDPLIANPYYPSGATGIEAGHLVMVLTGPDAGDVQTIDSMALDSFGNETIILLTNPWKIQPNTGDIFIVAAADWGPEVHTQSYAVASNTASVTGPLVSPAIENLIGQLSLFIARSQTVEDINGSDSFAPFRELYLYGSQGVRYITSNTTQVITDGVINADATSGNITIQLLAFTTVLNQILTICKTDSSSHTITILAASGDYFGVPTVTSKVLTVRGSTYSIKFTG